ncbi:autoinducer 2 ABC transporter permease LsrC [Avibacterium paragallinarum]|uniref:Autoinducer 2 import system permease protein LsrC n=1 Tax=Avibacterium paragallinarum TaxID=728 RepID=A0AAE5TH65_AVIPA|nr:autoinducer 2 ABC transporter permease LsrC [Avibacterium paragallinarum]MEE3608938.1 autoinducer 2 ABC transporter permease LsrC [Avibacterium paragallinarum]MEE3620655.1 autoinducer 2 ABC transporter permease LsrC [Avibacterium paragallinarum]MEE3668295.1 autoinducer 2 ABC transporter permease LsrC [Avibacterium paragallinarum]MEE3680867.1 autoinducer 2 ABC transporter permease LsrC [Avibacterium paragallinarum]MEE4384952.1 autoinducer 2 ABC transporter permease LsrC [Avibacterium paragal
MWNFIQKNREITIIIAILFLFLLLSFKGEGFYLQTLTMIFNSSLIVILLTTGTTFVILTRNIDVSIGSIMGLCAVILGILLNNGFNLLTAFLFTLLTGLLAGLFNGILVTLLKIPAIVATLGTLGLYKGIMLLITGGKWIENLPQNLKQLSSSAFLSLSPIAWLVLFIIIFAYFILTRTQSGRHFYAVGDNLQGALQLGVKTNQIRIIAFMVNGLMASIAGIIFASQIGFVPNSTGSGLEMKAIAACVLGGISLLGGSGNLIGAILGAYFLIQIDSILVLLKVPAYWNNFIAGFVLLCVLIFDGRIRVMLTENLKQQRYSRFLNIKSD